MNEEQRKQLQHGMAEIKNVLADGPKLVEKAEARWDAMERRVLSVENRLKRLEYLNDR